LKLVERGFNVILLAHATSCNVPNPNGPDYQEYRPALQSAQKANNMLAVTQKCVHGIFFLTSLKEYVKVDPTKKRSRTIVSANERIVGVQTETWYLAKNWFGLREHIEQGDTPAKTFKNILAAGVPVSGT
jgi:hypothetical protein